LVPYTTLFRSCATDRVGTVGYDHRDSRGFCGDHHLDGRGWIGVVARAHVGQVHHQHLDAAQHLGSRSASRTIERVDWSAAGAVDGRLDLLARSGERIEAVLGTEEGDQFDRGTSHHRHRIGAIAAHCGQIGYQADALAADQVQRVTQQHVDSRANLVSTGIDNHRIASADRGAAKQHRRQCNRVAVQPPTCGRIVRPSTLLLSMSAALACSAAAQPVIRGPHPTATSVAEARPDTVEALLRSLTVRQKVAQLVMPWILGDSVPDSHATMRRAYNWVENLELGGVIVSTGSPLHIADKMNRLQRRSKLPLLVSADFEAGTTLRMATATPFPTQMGIAATGNPEYARVMGRVTAAEGRAVGVHLAFAPVADVNSNPDNPIINTRSFGGDPRDVARFVTAAIEGMREGGILSTAKHFPGHGATETDSHLALPTITAPWSRFDTLELVPFRA